MVGPISTEERAAFARKLQVAVTLLVGGSMGLAALGAGGALPQAGAATIGGLAVGVLVAWYIVPDDPMPSDRRTPPPEARAPGTGRERELADGRGDRQLPDSERESADLERRDPERRDLERRE
jgi:hypothetical protein